MNVDSTQTQGTKKMFTSEKEALDYARAARFMVPISAMTKCREGCIDGRREGAGTEIVRPGGNPGGLMTMFAACRKLDIPVNHEQLFELYLQHVIGGDIKNFGFHTDKSYQDGEPGMGCGHLRLARETPEKYGLQPVDMQYLFRLLGEAIQNGATQEVLSGSHEEQAILIVHSNRWGIEANIQNGAETATQVFVYHSTFDGMRLINIGNVIWEFLRPNNITPKIIGSTIREKAAMQLGVTAKSLAGELNTYHVRMRDEDGEPEIIEP